MTFVPDDIDDLPTAGVGAFIRGLAEEHGIRHRRSRFDDWAEAVARVGEGDDVVLDHTEKLLVELAKRKIVSGRQASRLLNNYMEEKPAVLLSSDKMP